MKNSFKLLSLLALSSLVAAPLMRADEPPAPPAAPAEHGAHMQQMRARRLQQLDENLKLTDIQKAQINAIWDKSEEQAKVANQESRREARKERREMMKATHDQVRAVLTPEQQKIFDTLKPEGPRGKKHGKAD